MKWASFAMSTMLLYVTITFGQENKLGSKSIEELQEIFVNNLGQFIKEDISAAITKQVEEGKRPLLEFGQKLLEQDLISKIAKQAVELLNTLEEQLKQEENAAKAKKDKQQEKEIRSKREQVIKTRQFLKMANKYLDKEIDHLNHTLQKVMENVNRNLEAAEQVIKEFLGPKTDATPGEIKG